MRNADRSSPHPGLINLRNDLIRTVEKTSKEMLVSDRVPDPDHLEALGVALATGERLVLLLHTSSTKSYAEGDLPGDVQIALRAAKLTLGKLHKLYPDTEDP